MKNHLFQIIILLTSLTKYCSAQWVTVLDRTTQLPLPGVMVYSNNPKQMVQTNAKGQFELSGFMHADSIFFKIVSHSLIHLTYQDILDMRLRVDLMENPLYLSAVTISSNRWGKSKMTTPNRVEKISMKDIAFQNPQTAADVLGMNGYAFIQKSQLAGGSPMLRGMATNRVLLVVDNVRMNNAIFRAGNVQNVISLDANALENVEILFGPGAVMYGSDAIGGIMDFQTLKPRLADSGKHLFSSGNLLMRNSTANAERTQHVDFQIGLKKWAFVSSFTRSEYGDLRSGSQGNIQEYYRPYYVMTIDNKDYMLPNEDSTVQIGTRYKQSNFMQKVQYSPNQHWDIDYAFHLSETSPYNRYDRLTVMQTSGPYKNKLRWAEWYYGPQRWNMHRLGISHSKPNKLYDGLRFIAARQHFEESRHDREFMVRELHSQQEKVNAISLNMDLDKQVHEKVALYYGAEWLHNTVLSEASLKHVITGEVTPSATRYPDGSTWRCFGVYASLKYEWTRNLILNAGVRYTSYRIHASFDTTYFPFPYTSAVMKNDALNGSIGLVYTPRKSWQLYANAATGFRAPNIDDMGKVFESTPGYLVVPNPDLKPEHVLSVELGAVKTISKYIRIDAAAYYSWLQDAMIRRNFVFNGQDRIRYLGNPSIVQAIQNAAQVNVYGLQAGVEAYYKQFGIKSNISFQSGREQSEDSLQFYPLRHAAPLFGSTRFNYQRKKLKLEFYVDYNAGLNYEELALTERISLNYAKDERGLNYVPAWYTLNAKAAYFVSQFVMITAGVENIANKLYRPYSSGINAPGRNLIVSLKARF